MAWSARLPNKGMAGVPWEELGGAPGALGRGLAHAAHPWAFLGMHQGVFPRRRRRWESRRTNPPLLETN